MVRRPDLPLPRASSPKTNDTPFFCQRHHDTARSLIQDRVNIVAEANWIGRPAVSEPCCRDDANDDDCNKHHDDARSTGWG